MLRFLICLLLSTAALAQPTAPKPYSQRMADAFLRWYPDSLGLAQNKAARWGYEKGLMLLAIKRVAQQTGLPRYHDYVGRTLDYSLPGDGTIVGYKAEDYNLDNINTGRVLLALGRAPGPRQAIYRQAAQLLHQQLAKQPHTSEGGYWHKKKYTSQMWLDGLYMAEPFAAEYSQVFAEPAGFDHVAQQFALVEKHLVDPKTGLLYHGWDESHAQKWANSSTGQSPNFWSRGMGWYAMALVDVLDYFPKSHPQRVQLVKYLQRLAPVLARYQDAKTCCWFQVTDQGQRAGNYVEASGSCMFVYALAKGVRLGYLDKKYAAVAKQGYAGILQQFVQTEPDGSLALTGTVSVGGLGGSPYRDGSYEYYLNEPLKKNDFKGVGPFIMASLEMETAR
ncbi:glycoside hydrolase family 105 protein [Hymenobacter sp. BT559]|uniref:glycoside hydrolase family 88/105 protein n=1 Tax=Hymenobacter sp. BT559 TaxID=2795729 RepID=UPI0025736C2C|nr:glycoside hydrolase family 88 protein [Hymenobacter sp. BT559]